MEHTNQIEIQIRNTFAEARKIKTFQDYLIVYDAEQVHEIINVTSFEADINAIKDKIQSENYSLGKELAVVVILLRIPSNIKDVEYFIQIQLTRLYLNKELSKVVYEYLCCNFAERMLNK